eukprot:jgi/Galph1/4416/GphlegSOOS_G3073.1
MFLYAATRVTSYAARLNSFKTSTLGRQIFLKRHLSIKPSCNNKKSQSVAFTVSLCSVSEDRSVEKKQSERLSFVCGACVIPHFDKRASGGEDAYFISEVAAGVFDGVGGWSSVGVDAGLYSARLSQLTQERSVGHSISLYFLNVLLKIGQLGPCSVVEALEYAVMKNSQVGSSTALVVGLCKDRIIGVNVGDSGLVVLRNNTIMYRTEEQQHYFNCPYQLGCDSADTVQMGQSIDFCVKEGDIIVLGTDGLFDNLFSHDILRCIQKIQGK